MANKTMSEADRAATRRADEYLSRAMWCPDRCTFCDKQMDPPHVDAFHRFTPLCGECYADRHRREVTARVFV
jgi:hypothetical protein